MTIQTREYNSYHLDHRFAMLIGFIKGNFLYYSLTKDDISYWQSLPNVEKEHLEFIRPFFERESKKRKKKRRQKKRKKEKRNKKTKKKEKNTNKQDEKKKTEKK